MISQALIRNKTILLFLCGVLAYFFATPLLIDFAPGSWHLDALLYQIIPGALLLWGYLWIKPLLLADRALYAKRFTEAISRCEQLIAQRPRSAWPLITLAAAYVGKHQPTQAIEACDKAISLDPNNPASYVNKGVALIQSRRYQESLDCSDKALALNAYSILYSRSKWIRGFAMINKAICLFGLKHRDEAFAAVNEIISTSSDFTFRELYAIAIINRARFLIQSVDYTSANSDLEEASGKVKYNLNFLHGTRGLLELKQERFELALDNFSKSIAINPCDAEAYWFRHQVYEKLGDTQRAQEDLKVANDLGFIPCAEFA